MSLSSRRAWIEIDVTGLGELDNGVALLTESVDRNIVIDIESHSNLLSLSSRRAWIEMPYAIMRSTLPQVALLTESVDRNAILRAGFGRYARSLSSRRAWIEINVYWWSAQPNACRSPHGERG